MQSHPAVRVGFELAPVRVTTRSLSLPRTKHPAIICPSRLGPSDCLAFGTVVSRGVRAVMNTIDISEDLFLSSTVTSESRSGSSEIRNADHDELEKQGRQPRKLCLTRSTQAKSFNKLLLKQNSHSSWQLGREDSIPSQDSLSTHQLQVETGQVTSKRRNMGKHRVLQAD